MKKLLLVAATVALALGVIILAYAEDPAPPTPPPAPPAAPPSPDKSTAGMVRIPGGTFMMGCSPGDSECNDNEKPEHQVRVNSFWMDVTEVTQEKYQSVMGRNPSGHKGCANCPVENVLWDDADTYCSKEGKRLPTEAEWEYAARGGTTGACYGRLAVIAWYPGNAGGKTHPVHQKRPNAYGLHDMLGNVGEWCADLYGETYYSESPSDNPKGPTRGYGPCRVLRGGSWVYPKHPTVSQRGWVQGIVTNDSMGFRCARD